MSTSIAFIIFVTVQFNAVAPKVMIDSLRHNCVNGEVAFKLPTICSVCCC